MRTLLNSLFRSRPLKSFSRKNPRLLPLFVRSFSTDVNLTQPPTQVVSGLSNDLLLTLSLNFQNDGATHEELIRNLSKNNIIQSEKIYEVMKQVDRKDFVGALCVNPYHDKPQNIGCGATITAPHMHALALENLLDVLQPGNTVLDIGSGSGYLTVCMALLVGEHGKAYGIDHAVDLVRGSEYNVRQSFGYLLDSKRIIFHVGDGSEGLSQEILFDCIHVGAACQEIPKKLITQLKKGGKLLVPILSSSGEQDWTLIEKTSEANDFTTKSIMKVVFSLLEKQAPTMSSLKEDPLFELNKVITELEKEGEKIGEKIKQWQSEWKIKNENRKPSLKDYRADEAMRGFLEQQQKLTKSLEKKRFLRQNIIDKLAKEKNPSVAKPKSFDEFLIKRT